MAEGKKVLIVEDDEDISMIEEAYLEAAGFHTEILSDGKAVLSRLKQESFDLILLDLMLRAKTAMRYAEKYGRKWIFPFSWSRRGQSL